MTPKQIPGLAPISPPLGVNPSYCAQRQTTLKMKEKVWSIGGDTFHIVDQDNIEVVRCHGKALSFSDRKEFADAQGRPLFALRNKKLALHRTFYGEAPDGKVLFEVKSQWSFGKAKMNVTFTNLASDNKEIELHIRGDWFDRSANIFLGDVVVASIARSFLNVGNFFGADTYYVTVAPGVDLSLIAACCVCLDEKEQEK